MTKQARGSMVMVLLGITPGCLPNEKLIGESDDEASDSESSEGGSGEELPIDGDSTTSDSTTSDSTTDDSTTDDSTTDDSTTDDSTTDDSTTDDSTTGDCGPDNSGVYLFALGTTLGPDLPLQFVLTLDLIYAGDCSATGDFSFQSLSLDQGAQTQPREFVGEPLVVQDVTFDTQGNFLVDMGVVMVADIANPITGSDIEAVLMLDGRVVQGDALCGNATGLLISPLEYDLAGSTFAAIRLADDGSDPDTLPQTFPYRCDQVPLP